MQGIETPDAQKHEAPDAESAGDALLVRRSDDEAAQHEEEIHEQVSVANERKLLDMAVGADVHQRHHAGGDAAPAIQHREAGFPHGGRLSEAIHALEFEKTCSHCAGTLLPA